MSRVRAHVRRSATHERAPMGNDISLTLACGDYEITRPLKDRIGKQVGVKQFQATAILWMRGLLDHEYGVPFKSIEWFSELDESVEFTPPPGLKLTRLPHDKGVEA